MDRNRVVTVYRRHLPHWRQEGGFYFVTFRLADALPPTVIRELRWLRDEIRRRRVGMAEGAKGPTDNVQELADRLYLLTEDAMDGCYGC